MKHKASPWLLVEEVMAELRAEEPVVRALCEAGEFAYLQLPDGSRRIDRLSFRRFLRAHQLGYAPQYPRAAALPEPIER